MIVVTTPYVPGHRITDSNGKVFGLVVRSRGIGGNLMAGLRSLTGANVIDPRFRPTDERFEDPTTRRRKRVWADPSSGERRYIAED